MEQAVIYFYLFILGACLGSLFGVLIERLPKNEPVLMARSRCRACNGQIPLYENIPIVSYLLLKGRCRSCKAKIPLWVWLIEIVTPAILLALYSLYGPSPLFVHVAVLSMFLIPIGLIDLTNWIIPDTLTYPGMVLGLFLGPWLGVVPLKAALLGGIMGAGSFLLIRLVYGWIRGHEGMGLGDVKLMGMVGVFLGPFALGNVVLFSALLGLLFGVTGIIKEGKGLKAAVPFGFCIALGTIAFLGALPLGRMPWQA
ncbi:MAG: A24 family peptidase [Nitrospirota bacterium]|nr:A24 family peptidase [Nitrospirota bacterium]